MDFATPDAHAVRLTGFTENLLHAVQIYSPRVERFVGLNNLQHRTLRAALDDAEAALRRDPESKLRIHTVNHAYRTVTL